MKANLGMICTRNVSCIPEIRCRDYQHDFEKRFDHYDQMRRPTDNAQIVIVDLHMGLIASYSSTTQQEPDP